MGLWQGAWMWCVDGYHLQKCFSQQGVTSEQTGLTMARYQSWVCPIAKIISPTILDVREIFALPCHLSLCGQPSGTGKSFIINFQYLTHPAVCHWGAIPRSFLVSVSRAVCGSSHVTWDAGRIRATRSVTQASQVRSCNVAHSSPTDFDDTTTAAVVSVTYTRSLGCYSD